MALELYYTSSPRGLRPGASGLCTVAMTRTMSAALASRLESLCGYRPPSEEMPIDHWPAALSHWIVDVGGVERHILASVRPVRPDHTMRSNTLAHFAVLHASELDPAGAAWMIAQPETLATSWSGEPRLIDAERAMPRGGPVGARRCATWQSTAGDAGWAGVLANAAMLDPSKPTTVICPRGTRMLELALEAMSLVPAAHRWRVTFTTYFTQPIAGLRCTWRFCLDGTSAATAARHGGGLVIDACMPQPCTRTGAFIDAARSGSEPMIASASEPWQIRPQVAQPAMNAAARVAAFDAGTTGLERDLRLRVPQRRPVGVEEFERRDSPVGRTALAASVVVAVVLLSVIAVMTVIMRSMSVQSADLEARLIETRGRVSELEASGAEVDGLRADVERLHAELGSASVKQRELEAELEALRRQPGQEGIRVREQVPTAPGQKVPNNQDASQPTGSATLPADAVGGSAAVAMPVGPTRRPRLSVGSVSAPSSTSVREDVIGKIAPPPIDGLKESLVQLSWPEASRCGIRAVSMKPSMALEQCGFVPIGDSVLAFGVPGRGNVEIARVDVGEAGPVWTWLRGSVPQIRDTLAKAGLQLPEDWPAILGQVRLVATCADSRQRVAVLEPPRALTWSIRGRGMERLELEVPSAIAVAPFLEWAGDVVAITGDPGGALLRSASMGSISARIAGGAPSPKVRVSLDWIPSEAEVSVRRCIEDMALAIADERSLHAVWVTASRMLGVETAQSGAVRPNPEEFAETNRQFDAWLAERARQCVTQAQRNDFERVSREVRLNEFRAWLLESKLMPMRESLVQRKAACDRLRMEWSASLEGAEARIRPERDSPPVAVLSLAIEHMVPDLPDFTDRSGEVSRR